MCIWAARPMTVTRSLSLTQALMVEWMSPGSEELSAPRMMTTSLVPWEGVWYNAALAISRAFCRLAAPLGSVLRSSFNAVMWSLGLPESSEILIARPSRIPKIPSCEMGFCSKNSRTKAMVYVSVSKCLVGLRSFSSMARLKSSTSRQCLMIPRCSGVVSFWSRSLFVASSMPPSTPLRSPSSPSCKSQFFCAPASHRARELPPSLDAAFDFPGSCVRDGSLDLALRLFRSSLASSDMSMS